MAEETLNIFTTANGAGPELFQHCLDQVKENIADPNTDPTAKRSIIMRVDIQPEEDRSLAHVTTTVTTKLANLKPVKTVAYFGRTKAGELVAVVNNIMQPSMFDPDAGRDITPLSADQGGRP